MNSVQLDIQQLRIKHILFKSRLRSVLFGGDFDEGFFSERGPVDTWFAEVGMPKYSQFEQIKELYRIHRELIVLARQLISLYHNSRIEEAHDGLRLVDQKSEIFLRLLSMVEQLPV